MSLWWSSFHYKGCRGYLEPLCRFEFKQLMATVGLGQGSSSSPSIALSVGKQSHRVSVLRFFPFGSFWKNRAHKIADISWKKNIFAFLIGGIYCIQPALSRANFFLGKNYSKKLLLCFLPKCPPHGKRCFSYDVRTASIRSQIASGQLFFWSIRVKNTVHGT
jgi:hypothetical protein